MTHHHWTPAEVALLHQRYPQEGASEGLALALGRSRQAVRCQAKHLRLRVPTRGTRGPGLRRWARENGYPSVTARRLEKWRYLSELEWPACGLLSPAQRRLLASLEVLGPTDPHELRAALGQTPRSHHVRRQLRALAARGLVQQVGRRMGSQHSHPLVWTLVGPAAEAARRRRVQEDLR